MSQDMCAVKNDSAWTATNTVPCCDPAMVNVDGVPMCLSHALQAVESIERQVRQDEAFKPWADYCAAKRRGVQA